MFPPHASLFRLAPSVMYANEMERSKLAYDFVRKGPFSLEFRPDDIAPLNQTVMIFDRYLGGLNFDAQHSDNLTKMLSDRHFNVPHDLTSQLYHASVSPFKNCTYRYEFKHKGGRSMTDIFNLDIGRHYLKDDLSYLALQTEPKMEEDQRQEVDGCATLPRHLHLATSQLAATEAHPLRPAPRYWLS
ncbi:hypothetical protein E2C01_018334 [Portunus trituberculatus]|uniref:Uncharacterized protein n=1 Tax=Portunus trituberculatus TaxID=210409 RepID=A0A5B7DVU8_PORTR|nr:hypothetical protein [Portunus trituberculatus]